MVKRRITRLEKKIIDLWKELGTIEFNYFLDLTMMLGEQSVNKVKHIVYKMVDEGKLFLVYKDYWYLDYIPF